MLDEDQLHVRRTLPHFGHYSRQEVPDPRPRGRWSWSRQIQSQARLHPQHFQQRKGLSERTSPVQQKSATLTCPSSVEPFPSMYNASCPPANSSSSRKTLTCLPWHIFTSPAPDSFPLLACMSTARPLKVREAPTTHPHASLKAALHLDPPLANA